MQAAKRRLIEIAALIDNLVILEMKKPAAAQTLGITPLEYGPISVLKTMLDPTDHGRPLKILREHFSYRLAANHRVLYDLMIYSVGGI